MSVKVTNTEARVHSIGLSNPRDYLSLRPGDNYVSDAMWKRAEKAVADLVKAGTLKVETGVEPPTGTQETKPPPSSYVPPGTDREETQEEAADEAAGSEGGETKGKRKRW